MMCATHSNIIGKLADLLVHFLTSHVELTQITEGLIAAVLYPAAPTHSAVRAKLKVGPGLERTSGADHTVREDGLKTEIRRISTRPTFGAYILLRDYFS